jgi:hypothetical protein
MAFASRAAAMILWYGHALRRRRHHPLDAADFLGHRFRLGVHDVINRTARTLRGALLGAAIAATVGGAVVSAVTASATPSVGQFPINATGSITPPDFQTFAASSTTASPVHVTLTLTQSSAVGFTMTSVVSDSTAGATLTSNNVVTDQRSIPWNDVEGDTYTAKFFYGGAGTYLVTDTVTDSNGATATAEVQVNTLGSAYSPVAPTRILDSRNGTGTQQGKVGANSIVKLRAEGAGPIPASGVTAVVLNVTVVAGSGGGYVTVYPSNDGTSVPKVSSVNYTPGAVVPNLVTVPVGSDGYIYLANTGSAPIDLIADVNGYYSLSGANLYSPAIPERLLDTRKGTGAPSGAVPNNGTVKLLVALGNSFLAPAGDMSAVAVNITVVNPSAGGYVTAYADGANRPGTSNLNYTAGQTVANSAIVPVAANGEIDLTNVTSATGSANLLVDVVGYYSSMRNWADSAFVPIAPSRVLDSRKYAKDEIQNGLEYDLNLGSWAKSPTTAIEMNATVTNTLSGGYLSLYTYGYSNPGTSSLDWTPGLTVANAAYVTPNGINGWMAVYNGGGAAADVILDVAGYFQNSTL